MATIGGKWVGLGIGDASEEVGKIRDFMRRKFRGYAGQLPDTRTGSGVPLFDVPMAEATLTMQRAYAAEGRLAPELANGYIGNTTKVVMGYLKAPSVDIRPMLFTVCGTGVPWWVGPDADTARAVEGQYNWQPIGYPAAPFPMGRSIGAGKAELRAQFNAHRAQVERCGGAMVLYSQGGCVGSEVWQEDIRPRGGSLHWALPHLKRVVTFGNPHREEGRVYDDRSGVAVAPPNTSGVTGTLMVDTPDWWHDYAHKGDLYAAGWTGDNAASQDKTAIWQIIRGSDVFSGPDSLLAQFLELAVEPLPGAIGAFTAMFSALSFFGSGTRDHVNYQIGPAVEYLRTGR